MSPWFNTFYHVTLQKLNGMKKLLAIVFLVLVLYGIWWWFFKDNSPDSSPKVEALKVSKHSHTFNQSINDVVKSYLDIKSAFVEADSVKAKEYGIKFLALVDSMKMDNLKKDTSIYTTAVAQIGDIKSNGDAMVKETNLTEMRQDFKMVTENFYPFLKTIHYEGPKLFLQNCPMAFGEGKDANWISDTTERIDRLNPYLGKHDPVFKSAMLHCGTVVDSIE